MTVIYLKNIIASFTSPLELYNIFFIFYYYLIIKPCTIRRLITLVEKLWLYKKVINARTSLHVSVLLDVSNTTLFKTQ